MLRTKAMALVLGVSIGWTANLAGATTAVLPAGTINQRLTVEGRLELGGENYFLDPRFVIVDEQNNRTVVTSWAPLEIPPMPPGAPKPAAAPRTMRHYLHRRFSIIGVHRVVVRGPIQRSPIGAPGESYLEVEVVTELTTGNVVFKASSTTEPSTGEQSNAARSDDQRPTEAKVRAEAGDEQAKPNAGSGTDSDTPPPPTPPQSSQKPPEREVRP